MNFFSGARAHFIPERDKNDSDKFKVPKGYQSDINHKANNIGELKLSENSVSMLGVSKY